MALHSQILAVLGLCRSKPTICHGVTGNGIFGKSAGGGIFNSVTVFGGTSVPLQPRIIMAVLLGVAVVSNITVPNWQSFDAMTGFLVILQNWQLASVRA